MDESAFFQPYEEIATIRRQARIVLGVAEGSGRKEIGRAFQALARQRHPDVGGNLDSFTRIVNAYLILTKPDPRGFCLGEASVPLDVPESPEDYLEWWLRRFGP